MELKQRPGVVDIIAQYDPMMVPPIWLVNDPQPSYPEELGFLSKRIAQLFWLQPRRRGKLHERVGQKISV